jgi:hypothetical protein
MFYLHDAEKIRFWMLKRISTIDILKKIAIKAH